MAGLEEMVAELESSVGEIERETRGSPSLSGWFTAHRKRLASLRLAIASGSRARTLLAEQDFSDVVGDSDAFLEVLAIIERTAPTDATVLVNGETGTGKRLIARKIHQLSRRSAGPFIALDCAGLARADAAVGGTLYIDEVATLAASAQAVLLRLLVDGTDIRVVAATGRDLEAEVAAGRFRQDLLQQLDVVRLRLPALRDREGDVTQLANHMLARFAAQHGQLAKRFSPTAVTAMEAHGWPGNVRELATVIERAVILATGPEVTVDLLGFNAVDPFVEPEGPDMKSAVRAYKRALVERALDTSGGDNTAAARILGVHPKYLYQLMRELELSR